MPRPHQRVSYSPRASRAAREQAAYYESKKLGLGLQFLSSLQATERLIQSNPEGFPRIVESSRIRSVIVRRFPFRLLYALREDSILIVAVAHTARKPKRPPSY